MLADQHFRAATLLFYQNNYDQSLESINYCLSLQKGTSMIYSNRALIHYHMDNFQLAQDDITTALALNPLNYIVYFNSFSILVKQGDYLGGLRNLRCCISCLHLIYGRLKRDRREVLKSLLCCGNNFEAMVLLVLMDIQAEHYGAAEDAIVSFGVFQKNQELFNRLRKQVKRMQKKYSLEEEQQIYVILQESEIKRQRLFNTSPEFDGMSEKELMGQIQDHLQRFNHLYNSVNNSIGSITHMIPKPADYLTVTAFNPFNTPQQTYQHALVASH